MKTVVTWPQPSSCQMMRYSIGMPGSQHMERLLCVGDIDCSEDFMCCVCKRTRQ